MKEIAYIALGGNIGDVVENFCRAIEAIARENTVLGASSIYETEPWGEIEQPNFLNAVVKIATTMEPLNLLHFLQEIEDALGRRREVRWGARTIDLDIVLFGSRIIDSVELTVPHRYLLYRDFFLLPLLEIDPELETPTGAKLSRFAQRIPSQLRTIIGKREEPLWDDTITSLLKDQ